MSLLYDNIFTNNIFLGKSGFKTNDLNDKFWKEVPLNNKNKANPISPSNSVLFIVKTFSPEDSAKIVSGIQSGENVYFDVNGNLQVNDSSSAVILKYKNVLTKEDFSLTNMGNIFVDLSGNKVNIVRNDMIFSPNKHWILFTANDICYILYNSIHRQSFKQFYNQQSFDSSGASNSMLNNLFNQYCEAVSLQGDSNLLRTYADSTCNCVKFDDCIDNATGIHSSNIKYRNSIGNFCVCAAPACTDSANPRTSFMFKDGSGFYDRMVSKFPGATCPSVQNVICTTEISSAGDTSLKGTQINQQCGNQEPAAATTPPASTTTPPASTTTPPASTTTPSASTTPPPSESTTPPPSESTTPPPSESTTPSETPIKPTTTTPKTSLTSNLPLIVGGSFAVLAIIIGIIAYVMKKKGK